MVDTPEGGLVVTKLVLRWLWQLQLLVLLLQQAFPHGRHVAHCAHAGSGSGTAGQQCGLPQHVQAAPCRFKQQHGYARTPTDARALPSCTSDAAKLSTLGMCALGITSRCTAAAGRMSGMTTTKSSCTFTGPTRTGLQRAVRGGVPQGPYLIQHTRVF